MADSLMVDLAGEPMRLMADRAMFWPSEAVLFIADLHLGKGEALRRGGIAVPSGGTEHDLQRLQALLDDSGARELCVLGDFLHGAVEGGAWQQAWMAWRTHNEGLPISVIAGNHDRQLRRRAADWRLDLRQEGHARGPFHLSHLPHPASTHVIAGHLHPRVRFPGLLGRWPAFLLRPGVTVLPAFSLFTGGTDATPETDQRCIACLAGLLAELPARRPGNAPSRRRG